MKLAATIFKYALYGLLGLAVLALPGWVGAFVGPTGSAGSGSGKIATDAAGNLGINAAVDSATKLLLKASSTSASEYSLRVLQSDGSTPLFIIRNDGKVGIGGNVSSTLLAVGGNTWVNGALTATTLSGSLTGTLNASNISAGAFASSTGGGNFSFPGNVGIGTTGPGVKLDVQGGQLRVNNLNIISTAGTDAIIQTQGTEPLYLNRDVGGDIIFFHGNSARNFIVRPGGVSGASLMVTAGGNVGIGTTTPAYLLHVNGDVGANAYYYISDRSLKTNIRPVSGLETILRLQGVAFDWRADGKKGVGLIAQDVEKVLPEVVAANENNGLKSVEYGSLVAPLIESVKELHALLEKQERRIAELEAALREREAALNP
jgi:hypothetical protein